MNVGANESTANDRPERPPVYETSLLEDHPAAAIAPLSDELAAKVQASEFSDELIERVLAVRPDRGMIEAWIDAGWPGPADIEVWVANTERVLASTLASRTATWADYEMLTDICANSPENVGDSTVTVERGPNPYAAYRLQEHANVNVLEDRRVGLGMSAASGRNTYIEGERTSVNCMSGWRIRDGFRGMGLSNLLRSGAGPGTSFFGLVTYYYVRLQNTSAAWIAHIETDMEDRPDGFASETDSLTASLSVFPAQSRGERSADFNIRAATPDDLPRCVELINRTHGGLDLFRPYTLEFLGYRLDDPHWGPKPPFNPPVYGWPDFCVAEVNGEIVACGGLWDRGRDIREVWRRDGDEVVLDPTALMDFGFADGYAAAMAGLLEQFADQTLALGRSGMLAALEFVPDLQAATAHLMPTLDTRELHVMPFRMPGLNIDLTVRRPYTDIAYW